MVQKKPVGSQKATAPQKRPVPASGRLLRTGARPGRPSAPHTGREEVGSRLAWIVGGGLAAVVALLVLVGIYNDRIGPARETAIAVGKHQISLGYYRDRLKAATVDAGDASQVGAFNKESSTTDLLEEEQIYLQRAGSLGVTVADNDITAAMAKAAHFPLGDGTVKDPATFEASVRSQLQRTGLSLDQFRELATAQALKDKATAQFKSEVTKQTLAVKGTELVFSTEQKGRAAQERLGNGDTFNDIAADSVADPSNGRAQPIDWTPVPFGLLAVGLDDVASKLSPGDVSDLIKIDAGGTPQWVLLTITDRDPTHDITDVQTLQIANKKRDAWFEQQKRELGVHSFVDGANARWAAIHTDLPQQPKASATAPVNPRRPGGLTGGQPPAGGPPGAPAVPPGPQPAGPPAPPSVPNGTP